MFPIGGGPSGRRDEAGEADDVRVLRARRLEDLMPRHHHAEVHLKKHEVRVFVTRTPLNYAIILSMLTYNVTS